MKKEMTVKEMPIGTVINTPGSSREYKTGGWRNYRPKHDASKCISCLRCWIYCPDGCIIIKDGKNQGINYDYCKGCGICAEECPDKIKAIEMVEEKKEK